MQKRLLYSTAVLAALALGSCSNDETLNGGLPETTGASQVIEISVANAGSGLTTRAGRPLLSSEAKQTIENVKIIICDESGSIKADTLITDWMTNSQEYNDAGHGRKVRFTLGSGSNAKLTGSAGGTKYTIYAFGYHGKDSDSPYDSQYTAGDSNTPLNEYLKTVGNGQKWDTNTVATNNEETVKTFSENFTIKNTSDDNAEELFAGSAEITVNEKGNFSQGVTLHRQVAGMFTYAYNVPYFSDAKYLKVYASQENQALVLGSFYSKVLGNNGTGNTVENVVNGTDTQDQKTLLYQIDLSEWFTKIVDVNNDGIIDTYGYTDAGDSWTENQGSVNWKKPSSFNKVTLVKGSVFGGEFLIPFKAKTSTQTLTLELTNESGTTLRTWTVKLPTDQVISNGTLTSWNVTSGSGSWSTDNSVTESQEAYSILRNHLYGIGKKTAEGNGTDKEDPDPDPDGPDIPQDLNTKQEIQLQVNDNWEVIHQMVVD